MSSTYTDRIDGLSTSVAVKAPVIAATTANITLSGLQTVDGVVLAAGNRVLVKNQTTESENGIYAAATSTWVREPDFDGSRDVVNGTLVWDLNGNIFYQVTTSGAITIGTTNITFGVASSLGITGLATADTIAVMTALPKSSIANIDVSGYTTVGDGGGGRFYWDSTSAATANGGTIIASGEPGTGRWLRIYDDLLTTAMFGDNGDWNGSTGTDNTLAIQAAIDYCETVIVAGNTITLAVLKDTKITSGLTVTVNSSKIPNIIMYGSFVYDGVNTNTALTIGTAATGFTGSTLDLSVLNFNQSDWSSELCIGIKIINANGLDGIRIRKADNFTLGVQALGDGGGVAYNNTNLGWLINNKVGLDLANANSGWTNENTWIGGRFGVFTGVNATLKRWSIRCGTVAGAITDNNVFIKPSFEMNSANTGASKTVGILFQSAASNHVIDCRSEGTEIVAEFDALSSENIVEVGFSDASSEGAIEDDSGFAGNVIVQSRKRHERHTKPIFIVSDLKSRTGLDGSNLVRVSGMVNAQASSGAIQDFMSGSINANSIGFDDTGRALGVLVDTETHKKFTLSVGYEGAAAGRLYVLCFNAAGTILSGSAPLYAQGTSNNTLTSYATHGYRSGSDTSANQSVKFHTDVKYAFVGIIVGGAAFDANSFRLYAQDGISGVAAPMIRSNPTTIQQAPTMRYATTIPIAGTWKVGEILFNTTPAAAGFIGWVCTTAGTPGTWKTFGAISA